MPVLLPDPPSADPGPLDVITLAEAKAGLNIATAVTDFDTELASYITAASRLLDKECGPVVKRSVTETRDGPEYGASYMMASIWLQQAPVYAITSIVEYDQTTATTLTVESHTSKTANDYLVDLTSGRLRRRRSGIPWHFPIGPGNVVVVYDAGRYLDTASVDAKFKQAAALIVANLWRREQGGGNSTFGAFPDPLAGITTFFVPNAVKEVLADEFRGPLVG